MFSGLNKRLQISEIEIGAFYTSFFARFFFQAGWVISWTILISLFVEKFGILSLPLFFAIDALIILLGSVFSHYLLPKISLLRFLSVMLLGTIGLVSLSLFFSPTSIWFFVFLLFAKSFFFFQASLALYRRTETLFSTSSAMRLFPKLESAITLGALFGAIVTLGLLSLLSQQFVLLGWILFSILALFIVLKTPQWLHFIPHIRNKPEFSAQEKPLLSALREVLKTRFLQYISFVLLLQTAFFTFTEVEFLKEVQSHISHKEHSVPISHEGIHYLSASSFSQKLFYVSQEVEKGISHVGEVVHESSQRISSQILMHQSLAHDLGVLHLLFALFALFIQFVFTPWILRFLGVVGTFLSYSLILLLTLLGYFLGYYSISWLRSFQHGTHSLSESPFHLSFYSLSHHHRESIRLFLEGVMKPLGIFFAVGLFGVPYEKFFELFFLVCLTIVCALFFHFRKSFTHLSASHLSKEENIEAKLNAIEVLMQNGHIAPHEFLCQEFLKKNLPLVVREKILIALLKIGDPDALHAFLQVLSDKSESKELWYRTLETLQKFDISEAYWKKHAFSRDRLLKILHSLYDNTDDQHLKKLVIMNIFEHLPNHDVVPFFMKTLESDDEKTKSISLRSCQVFSDPEIVYYVRDYLENPSARLRSHAVIALWKFVDRDELRSVLDEILMEGTEDSLISVLYAIGEVRDRERIDILRAHIDHVSREVRMHALLALAKLGETSAIPGILDFLFSEDQELSRRLFYMLHRVDEFMLLKIQKQIQIQVSQRVSKILLTDMSQEKKEKNICFLRHLYWLAGRYDDLVLIGGGADF